MFLLSVVIEYFPIILFFWLRAHFSLPSFSFWCCFRLDSLVSERNSCQIFNCIYLLRCCYRLFMLRLFSSGGGLLNGLGVIQIHVVKNIVGNSLDWVLDFWWTVLALTLELLLKRWAMIQLRLWLDFRSPIVKADWRVHGVRWCHRRIVLAMCYQTSQVSSK